MKVTFESDQAKFEIEIDTQQDWTSCLMTALIASLPCFLEAFVKCLQGGNGGSGGFKPGDRHRCA